MTNFNIEIVSDSVCPWCYVGKRKLDAAITAYKQSHPDSQDTFSITWMPFYLNPLAPKYGVDKTAYYQTKFGEERTSMIFEKLTQAGRENGINFKFGGKTGNTRDSHRLIQLGKTKSPDMQTKVVEQLFAAYFENERDITSHDVLLNAAVSAGLDEKEAKDWLETDKGGKEVDEEVEHAKLAQISGVPNFMIQGKYEVGGAQESGVFLGLFEKINAGEEGPIA
ncbi:related to dithiol-disulfide isomerase involved in polyketide biosynthesis [Rhynchosporium agropyri]|uniref:Related to dithiol-disulfide isomerase involved in polyketide biosynthesis n=1 Tax=Rhynchosporium agropyri TaxID=914238 RepID=A0A1E1KD17_9HELO|nr:related to dithiol-disulfide isomerase involved in polyketide biosynthesis [Rhynchosporium agropyri]